MPVLNKDVAIAFVKKYAKGFIGGGQGVANVIVLALLDAAAKADTWVTFLALAGVNIGGVIGIVKVGNAEQPKFAKGGLVRNFDAQCSEPVYGHYLSPPERCAHQAGHEGKHEA